MTVTRIPGRKAALSDVNLPTPFHADFKGERAYLYIKCRAFAKNFPGIAVPAAYPNPFFQFVSIRKRDIFS
jgi:hypothetical protein